MTTNPDLATLFLAFSRNKLLNQYWPRLKACVETMSTEQIWWRPNDASNSVGNIILHLNGNVTQWLVASFNRDQDILLDKCRTMRHLNHECLFYFASRQATQG